MESPTPPPLGRRTWLTLAAGAIGLTVLPYLTAPTMFASRDFFAVHDLYKEYFANAIRAGRLPLWNPHVGLGRPFLADVDSAFFYPPQWLFVVLERHVATAFLTAAHILLGLAGLTKLARLVGVEARVSLAVALAFFAGAPVVACFQNGLVNYGNSLCYAPLALACALELASVPSLRRIAVLAVVLGAQFLCGHPQMSWITGLGCGLLTLGLCAQPPWTRSSLAAAAAAVVRLGLAASWAMAIAAAAILPLRELMGQSNRGRPSLAFSGSYPLDPYGWTTLVVPGGPWRPAESTHQLYLGTALLVAGFAGLMRLRDRTVRAILLMALVAALVAAGPHTPAFRLFYLVIPALSAMRIHARTAILVSLSLALGAGLFLSRAQRLRAALLHTGALGAAAALASVAILFGYFGAKVSLSGALTRATLIAIAALLIALWVARAELGSKRVAPIIVALLATLTAFDLASSTIALKRLFSVPDVARGEEPLRRALADMQLGQPGGTPLRLYVPFGEVRENAGMRYGWSTYTGYAALTLGRVWEYLHAVHGLPVPMLQNTYPETSIALRFGPFPYDSMNLTVGYDISRRRLAVHGDPDPRAYVAVGARIVADQHEAITLMRDGHDFHRVALVEQPLGALDRGPFVDAPASARITRFEPERVVVETAGARPGILILAEAWYPGWTATVNGTPAPCVPANAWMRAVPIPAGHNEIVFRFRCTHLPTGIAVSFAAIALAAFVLRPRRRAGRETHAPITTNGPREGAR